MSAPFEGRDGTQAPPLPYTWRPFGARVAGTIAGVALVALSATVWITWGPDVRSRFTPFQKGTLIFLGLLAFSAWFSIMRCRVTATSTGLTVVNGYRRRDLAWAQVVAINLRRGAPWAGLDLSDGTSIPAVGIQSSDGPRAVQAVRELRVLLESNTPDHDR